MIGDDGQLQPSQEPFDKRVAGVVSGGKDYRPGIILDKKISEGKRLPIALTGKTYCKVDACECPIKTRRPSYNLIYQGICDESKRSIKSLRRGNWQSIKPA